MNYLIYEDATHTIRQMPQNYCVCVRRYLEWKLDFDLSCDKELTQIMFNRLNEYEYRFCSAETLINSVMDEYRRVPDHHYHVQGNDDGSWKECKGKFQITEKRGHFKCDECGLEITWADVVRDNQH